MDLSLSYKIPNDILEKIPEHFWPALAGELVSVFGPTIFEYNIYEDGTRDYPFEYISGTAGWHLALKMTCRKLDIDWLYEYYKKLEWYDSDKFDSEIQDLITSKFIDVTPKSPSAYYLWAIEEKEKPVVAYICDQEQCDDCSAELGFCYHTTDISHAVNFEEVEPGKWMEKE